MSFDIVPQGNRVHSASPTARMMGELAVITSDRARTDSGLCNLAFAAESLAPEEATTLKSVYNSFETTIRQITKNFDFAFEDYQVEAASIAGIFATNPEQMLKPKLRGLNNGAIVIQPNLADSFLDRPQVSTEAYDLRENRNSQLFSIVVNLLASRQDDFGELFFPTILVNPAEVGITVSIRLFYVYNDFKRSISGAVANYGRKSLIRAYADPTILKNEMTRVIPVFRDGGGANDNTNEFVPVAQVPTWTEMIGSGLSVKTSMLKVDNRTDLLGISQTDELLNSGIMGPSDNLDSYIRLEYLSFNVTDGTKTESVRITTKDLPDAVFTYSPQANTRRMILNVDNDGIVFDAKTLSASGVQLDTLPELYANMKLRVRLTISGSVVLDKAEAIVNRGSMSLETVRNANNDLVTGATFDAIAAKINSIVITGYFLKSYRANSNIRQRGQLVDSQTELRLFNVPYRSPICCLMPAMNSGADENEVVQALAQSIGARISNEAVTTLLENAEIRANYNPVANSDGDMPSMAAIGSMYVKPVYFEDNLDLSTAVDSQKSHERLADIRSAIVEKIRLYANEMYRSSEYKAAAGFLTGNINLKPVVLIGTDVLTANYIQSGGDIRLLGETFDARVASTIDERMIGKIILSFGIFDSTRNTTVHPLNSGNLLYSPENVITMNVSRDGQVSREMINVPRFAHIMNLPVMTVINITNLPEVVGKVTVNMHSIP